MTPARGTSRDDDSARCVFESRVQACGYDTARNDNGRYRWAAVRDMWRGWELMRTRAAAQNLFGERRAA